MNAPTFISWFAGCGMFDLGLGRAGWQCVGACEIDPLAREVYERQHGRPVLFFAEDVERVEAKEVPGADLWVGGFPCTDVSVAGQRAGIAEGTRSGLVHAFIRLAAERRPRFILLENVPGLLSGRTADDPLREVERDAMGEPAADALWFGALLGSLAGAGYAHGAWRVLDGQYFGVPQRRRRVFILLGRDPRDGAAAAEVLLEPEGVRGRAPARGAARAGAAAGAPRGARGGGGGRFDAAGDGQRIARAIGGVGGGQDPAVGKGDLVIARAVNTSAQRFDASVENLVAGPVLGTGPGSGYRHEVGSNLVAFHSTQDPISGPVAPALGKGNATGCGSIAVAFDMAQITHPDNRSRGLPAPSLHKGGAAHVAFLDAWSTRGSCSPNQHPVKEDGLSDALDTTSPAHVRRLTPVETERLQGLADGHTCTCGEADRQRAALRDGGDPEWRVRRLPTLTSLCRCADGGRYRLIGNGGVVPVLEWIGRRLRAAMEVKS